VEHLWQAAAYTHPVTGQACAGKIHVLRSDDARTVCGRSITQIGGTRVWRDDAVSTCQGCQNSLAAQARAKEQQARWVAEQEREAAEWRRHYTEYLDTPAWAARRHRVLERAGYLCEGCREQRATIAHHLHYRRVGREMLFDLVAVCDACHAAIHDEAR
jgi:5-methylcytosine-specific restriction endonuclease McrA